ncbi:L,D-transpeptidase family protein [Streptomyces sp. cmx-18-6]|uniref:L,D-transpeptidase family protein n=1 Tax=Streptomyces sp. cmx-18-6 TaxID=2790930 RepID=UPI00397F8C15
MNSQTLRTRFVPAALAVALLSTGVTVATAPPAAARPAAQPAEAASSFAAKGKAKSPKYYLKFVKNQKNPSDSRLHLMPVGKKKAVATWRAGSGNGSTNSCKSNAGWLPNGSYKIEFHKENYNKKIKGYVIKLQDKKCSKGTKRTELFIHSEMKKNGKQGRKDGKDSPYRWEGNHDYKSEGCIKLKPAHIKSLFTKVSKSWPKTLKVV